MNIFELISELEKADPEFLDRTNPRRRVFKYLGNAGKKVTAAAVPAVLASFFNRAYGQGTSLPTGVQAVLTLALQLEYLEYFFYDTALSVQGLVPAADRAAIETIRNDESGHIKSLRGIQGFAPGTAPTRNDFDYSGGAGTGLGPLRLALTPGETAVFYGAAQAFSDTGIRAYKGGAPVLNTASTKDILEAALNIHSVEARHNSHFRTVRRGLVANVSGAGAATAPAVAPYAAAPKSWISLRDDNGPTVTDPTSMPVNKPAAAVYGPGATTAEPAEDNVTQAGVNLTSGLGTMYSAALVSESFDEPLDAATVKAIARKFVTTTSGLFI